MTLPKRTLRSCLLVLPILELVDDTERVRDTTLGGGKHFPRHHHACCVFRGRHPPLDRPPRNSLEQSSSSNSARNFSTNSYFLFKLYHTGGRARAEAEDVGVGCQKLQTKRRRDTDLTTQHVWTTFSKETQCHRTLRGISVVHVADWFFSLCVIYRRYGTMVKTLVTI